MKKKLNACLCLILFGAFLVSTILICSNYSQSMVNGTEGTNTNSYSLVLNSGKNKLTNYPIGEGVSTVRTERSTVIEMTSKNNSAMLAGWGRFSTGGYCYNNTPLNSLSRIDIELGSNSSTPLLSYGWSRTNSGTGSIIYDVTGVSLTSSFNFDNDYPCYFKISQNGDSYLFVTSITLTFKCAEVPISPYGSEGIDYRFNDTTKKYYVSSVPNVANIVIGRKHNRCEVDTIGRLAFNGCTNVTSVYLPDSITTIEQQAFLGCIGLTSISIPNSVTSIGTEVFQLCTALESISLSSEITSISSGAFYYCSALTSISLPAKVTSIGEGAFCGCTSLTSIIFHEGIESIGMSAFFGCSGLETIFIPKSVTSIGQGAFALCDNLRSVTVDPLNTSYYAYRNSIIETATGVVIIGFDDMSIPDDGSITEIAAFAYNGQSISAISIPEGVTSIGQSAFDECSMLETITIPGTVDTIGTQAFAYCHSLEYAYIFEGVKTINDFAFTDCRSLTTVSIPSSVTSIGEYAFNGCNNLTVYYEGDAIPSTWNSDWNYNDPNYPITVVCGATGAPFSIDSFTGSTDYVGETYLTEYTGSDAIITIPSTINGNPVTVLNGTFYQEEAETAAVITTVIIPDTVEIVGENTFGNCKYLDNVVIGSGVNSIAANAFDGCLSLGASTGAIFYKGTPDQWREKGFDEYSAFAVVTPAFYSKDRIVELGLFYWHYVDGLPVIWE